MNSQTQLYWDKLKLSIDLLEPCTYEEVRKFLLENDNYKRYLGKAKNRTLI